MKSSKKRNPGCGIDEYNLSVAFIDSIDGQLRLLQRYKAPAGKDYEKLIMGRIEEKLDERLRYMKIRDNELEIEEK